MQDVSQDDIPIMLVGNKTDLRTDALQEGVTCIPTSYGEKLAMVSRYSHFLPFTSLYLYTDSDKMMLKQDFIKNSEVK